MSIAGSVMSAGAASQRPLICSILIRPSMRLWLAPHGIRKFGGVKEVGDGCFNLQGSLLVSKLVDQYLDTHLLFLRCNFPDALHLRGLIIESRVNG